MVSHAAPVYWQGRYMGMVGADVVGFSHRTVASLHRALGPVWIVNETGQVLADPDHPYPPPTNGSGLWRTSCPNRCDPCPSTSCCNPPTSFGASPTSTFTRNVSNCAPWYLLHAIPSTAITTRLLPRLYPALIIAGRSGSDAGCHPRAAALALYQTGPGAGRLSARRSGRSPARAARRSRAVATLVRCDHDHFSGQSRLFTHHRNA